MLKSVIKKKLFNYEISVKIVKPKKDIFKLLVFKIDFNETFCGIFEKLR